MSHIIEADKDTFLNKELLNMPIISKTFQGSFFHSASKQNYFLNVNVEGSILKIL